MGFDGRISSSKSQIVSQNRKRKISQDIENLSFEVLARSENLLPTLTSPDYYIKPSLEALAQCELMDPGYSSRVPEFTIGRLGYGYVKFPGMTDIRWLNLDQIVKFNRHEVVLYEDESTKPAVGEGLNKDAEVTLMVRVRLSDTEDGRAEDIRKKLRQSTERQGAHFILFNPANGEWKFLVHHFSRFGLNEDDEEDIIMDDANAVQDTLNVNGGEIFDIDEKPQIDHTGSLLSHSLPAHLGLDPVKMKEIKMLMFPLEEEEVGHNGEINLQHSKELIRSPLHSSVQRMSYKSSPPLSRKTPLALLEYNPVSVDASSPGTILMAKRNKGLPLKAIKVEGFKVDLKHQTPLTGSHSRNIVDAGLFMGRSFRVGWGPNGVLVHSGACVGSTDSLKLLSSVINLEKVAFDTTVRDENNKVKSELEGFVLDSPLDLHKEISHEMGEVDVGPYKLKLRRLVSSRLQLSEICRSYTGIIERQLEVPGLSSSSRLVLMHQAMVWELIRVLFSERENGGHFKSVGGDNEEDMMQDMREASVEVDVDALPLIRRAEFSFCLQEFVCHRVQDEVISLDESSYLEHIFLLLSGRQLDAAVELASSRGDVRLSCLLSQAGGSTVNRSDVSHQLDLWRNNGLDFNYIENARMKLFELLAGNIHAALEDVKVDWKRFLGMLMWYQLPPDTSLPVVFQSYQNLLDAGRAPYPVPLYVDEGPVEVAVNWIPKDRFDILYYLMLLHANEEIEFGYLKTMFSTFASTFDPLDFHMIWHQRAVLEAVGAFSSNDLHILDMGFVSQLLSAGKYHWAIYVVLHMPQCDDYPFLHANVIREILFQYCEFWSAQDSQREFIENLGIPLQWLHEAMAIYFNYHGNLSEALEHFVQCENWQKAHSIFVTSVAHKLFLSAEHSEIWRIATSMEDHKSEIENWELGAGIYISFYLLRNQLQEDENTMEELDSVESNSGACRDFLGNLNESLAVWGSRLPIDARVAYSKMAEDICGFLLSDIGGGGSGLEVQLSCYDTVFTAPIPEDHRSSHLQDAVSLFTSFLSELAT